MNASEYIDYIEALEILGLYKEGKHSRPNALYITWLVDRGLLTRYGTKGAYKYSKSQVQELFKKHLTEGLSLTVGRD